jgi:hypothetical protein
MFEVPVVGTMKVTVFHDVTPCSLVDCYRSFGETYLHLQSGKIVFHPEVGDINLL